MTRTLVDQVTETDEGKRLYEQERAILDVTELICEIMEEEEVSRSELARRLHRSKGYVTQLLDGRANMTIRTISDVFHALGRRLSFRATGDVDASHGVQKNRMLFDSSTWKRCVDWHFDTVTQGTESWDEEMTSESLPLSA